MGKFTCNYSNNNKRKMVRGVVVGEQSQSNQIILMLETLLSGQGSADQTETKVK